MKGERTLKKEEVLRDFTFKHDYVFCSILTENPHICKKIAELAIGRTIKEIVSVQAQKSIKESVDGKGVRFDVVFDDDANNVYDIEMQRTEADDIPRRARYYQSMMDLESLQQGRSYTELKNGYIIFICDFDLFGKDDYKYIASTMVLNHSECEYNDGSLKIFLNAAYEKDDMDSELRAFLDYVHSGQVKSKFASEIEEKRRKLLNNAERREEFMTLQENYEMHEQIGFEKGEAQGLIKGRIDGAAETKEAAKQKMLAAGIPPKQIAEFLDIPESEV